MGNVYPITFDDDRIVDSQRISTGPTHLQALERALAELIDIGGNGVAFATEIEKAPFAVNQYGWLLGSAAHAACPGIGGAPKTVQGLRFLDTTNPSQGMICVKNGYLEVYKDATATPGYETTPSWPVTANRMSLTTGLWEVNPVNTGVGISLVCTTQTVNPSQWAMITWTNEEFDTDGFWTSGTDLVIPAIDPAIYAISAGVWTGTHELGVQIQAQIILPAGTVTFLAGSNHIDAQSSAGSFSAIQQLSQSDTISVQVYNGSTGPLDFSAYLAIWKIGEL